MMTKVLPACAFAIGALVSPAFAQTSFATFDFRAEYNASAEDLGVQWEFDAFKEPAGTGWKEVTIRKPDGTLIIKQTCAGPALTNGGCIEAFNEASEPTIQNVSFERFKQLFPAGNYKFRGVDVNGVIFNATESFTHVIPAGPKINSPVDGSVIPVDNVVVDWEPVTTRAFGTGSITITSYRVILETDDFPGRALDVVVRPGVTRLDVPAQYIQRGHVYKLEVLAKETSGNQTLSEAEFETLQ
jgi:hypothetical protein